MLNYQRVSIDPIFCGYSDDSESLQNPVWRVRLFAAITHVSVCDCERVQRQNRSLFGSLSACLSSWVSPSRSSVRFLWTGSMWCACLIGLDKWQIETRVHEWWCCSCSGQQASNAICHLRHDGGDAHATLQRRTSRALRPMVHLDSPCSHCWCFCQDGPESSTHGAPWIQHGTECGLEDDFHGKWMWHFWGFHVVNLPLQGLQVPIESTRSSEDNDGPGRFLKSGGNGPVFSVWKWGFSGRAPIFCHFRVGKMMTHQWIQWGFIIRQPPNGLGIFAPHRTSNMKRPSWTSATQPAKTAKAMHRVFMAVVRAFAWTKMDDWIDICCYSIWNDLRTVVDWFLI